MSTIAAQGATLVALNAAVGVAAAFGLPSGAGPAMVVTNTAVVLTAVADPFEFGRTAELWREIAQSAEQESNDLALAFAEFKDYWEGEGSASLEEYWSNRMAPLLEQIKPAADAMAGACDGMATAQAALILALLAMTISASVALATAAATMATVVGAPAGAAAQWAIYGAWAAFAVAGVTALVAYLQSLVGAAGELSSSMNSMTTLFYEDAAARGGNKLTVPEAALPQLSDAMDSYRQTEI
ncbi:hypothetical protein [Enemella sp. A6]|uniref:hypothetical protein n=1 Tax=Enemella sp. A6 TaxID=3440152 RepID=UPI003EB6DABA